MNLKDTENIVSHFYIACFHAASKCPLYTTDDKSPSDIKGRIDDLIADLADSPVAYLHDDHAYVMTHHDILLAIFRPMYAPLGGFPKLAENLAQALHGNFTPLIDDLGFAAMYRQSS